MFVQIYLYSCGEEYKVLPSLFIPLVSKRPITKQHAATVLQAGEHSTKLYINTAP